MKINPLRASVNLYEVVVLLAYTDHALIFRRLH